jgi:transaldolase
VPAIRACLAQGINVNVTLLFAQQAHEEVMLAYLAALEERAMRGLPLDRVASVASFFVSRVDTLIDQKLDARATPQARALRGKAAIANARLAYRNFQRIFAGPRWEALAAKGARVQRPLWASTSTKDPSYPDVMYVENLIGRDTVNTMPTATIEAYRDHGRPQPDTVLADLAAADALLPALAEAGIEMHAITEQLLREGVAKFSASFDELLAALRAKAQRLGAAAR